MPSSLPPPRKSLPGAYRLPIRALGGGSKRLVVDCPRREIEVHVDRCALCARCVGLSLRDAYLVCTRDADGHDGGANEPPPDGPARLAPDAQPLRRGFRVGMLGAELTLLEETFEGNVGGS